MIGLTLTLLGGFEARLSSGATVSLRPKKAQALLAYLGMRPGERHSRDKLAALLWGATGDDQARDGLRHAIASLRRALAGTDPASLLIEGQTLALHSGGVEVDVATFERRVAEATPSALEEAAALYRGDLLLGFIVNEPLFEDWLVAERERLREMVFEALARLLRDQAKTADTERGVRTAVRLLGLDPLQEMAHRTLMRLYARQGRRGAALKQYQVCVAALQRELGTEPEPETKTLYQELLRRPSRPVLSGDTAPPLRTAALPLPDLPVAETPMFGREMEIAQLRTLLDDAVRGHGRIATVVGEAGIGKTRLVISLAADALTRGCRFMIGHCHESDSILPFGPWVDACRSSEVSTDQMILDALHPMRRAELTRLLPEASIASLPRASDSALPLFESVAALVEQVAAHQPLVMVIEDLHWADEMSLRLLEFVGRRLSAWPVLLVTTAREEELEGGIARRTMAELSRTSRALPIALSPLSRVETTLLVRALGCAESDAQTLAQLEEHVWTMSEGNPFVAVEAMRAVHRQHGRTQPGTLTLPASASDLVARRLDRLSALGQQIAALSAVMGRGFDFDLLRRASGVEEAKVADTVEEMIRLHVLQLAGDHLDFVHDRIRAVVYDRLLPPRRRLLHRAVAEALAAMATSAGDHSSDYIEPLAHHALRGELWEDAVRYLQQAGAKAAARSALPEARAWYEQALSAVAASPESRATLEHAFEIRLTLRPILIQLGDFRRVLQLLREAEALAERLDDDRRRGQVCAFATNIHSRLDEPDEAVRSGRRALDIAERLGDVSLRIVATTYLGQAHYYRGEYARVIELATANVAAMPTELLHEFLGGSQPPSINDRFRLIVSLAHLGRFAEAAQHEAEIIRLAERTHHPYTVGIAHHAAGTLFLVKGDWARARSVIERLITVLREGHVSGELPSALASSARALAHLGNASEALSRRLEAEALLEDQSARRRVGTGWIHYSLARACLVLGRPDEAERLARAAIESGSARTDFVPDTLQLFGDIAIHPERFDAERAEGKYRDALALAEPRGMRPCVAHCQLGLGQLYARLGKREQATHHLRRAATMYREMDMRAWLERAVEEPSSLA